MFAGRDEQEIANELGISVTHVHLVLKSEAAREVINRVLAQSLDLVPELSQQVATILPSVLEKKITLALSSTDERVSNSACTDLLAIGGLTPVKRIQVETIDHDLHGYKNLTEEELRAKILADLGVTPVVPEEQTVH
jgi:hypothetical protein